MKRKGGTNRIERSIPNTRSLPRVRSSAIVPQAKSTWKQLKGYPQLYKVANSPPPAVIVTIVTPSNTTNISRRKGYRIYMIKVY